jgi:hypothetical protein
MIYTCPMHPEIRQDHPGFCPKCRMALVPENEMQTSMNEGFLKTYKPLLTIITLILVPVIALALRDATHGSADWRSAMQNFMAGFFLVFSGLKLLDVRGFAKGYATYDLLAMRVKAYGYVYPFLELLLGLAYLSGFAPFQTNIATIVLMIFSGIGVTQMVMQKRKFECACLGTFIKVPLTKVTIVEDFGMAAMAALMLATMQ